MKINLDPPNKKTSSKNTSIKVTRKFLAEFSLADKLYSLIVRQLSQNKNIDRYE